ncbi:MAG TPA: hypothetical protein VIF61_09945 [Methylocystis sp.]|jgi:hypothetical protein
MSPLTLFLAKLLGAVLLTMAAAMAARGPALAQTAKRMTSDPGMVMIGGAMRIGLGLAVVIGHDVWTGGALPVAVTLFGWALYFSGLLLLFASPERLIAMVESMKLERNLPVYALGVGLVGLYFLGAGLIG